MAKLKKITVICGDDLHRIHLIQMRATKECDLTKRVREIARVHEWPMAEELVPVGVIEGLVQFAEDWLDDEEKTTET